MLSEYIEQGFGSKENYNCAEKILYGANQVYQLGLDKPALKLVAGFGGGMGIESTCGALTGGIMVLSHLFVKDYAHESTLIKELTQELFNAYHEKMGHLDCKSLKAKYRTPQIQCAGVIIAAAEALDEVIARHK